jgi:FecR protein
MHKLALIFASLLLLIGTPATAAAAGQNNWVVTQLSGDARVLHPGAQPASLKVNGQLTPGDTLLTGPSGRATLVRGGDYIIVAPRSELRLPASPPPAGFTRVIQNLGTLLFKVQHTGIPHFAVDTPMLAAVVKGTTFTVVVDQQRSAVQVIQGSVQVTALDGGMSRIVEGGRTVFVNHDSPKTLLDADKAAPAPTAPAATRVTVSAAGAAPLQAIATLTGGLVRADLSSPPPSVAAVAVADAEVTGAPLSQSPAAPVVAVAPTPGATVPATTTPALAAPGVATPAVTLPSLTPAVTAPVVAATLAPVALPSVTVPAVATPDLTVASVTTTAVTLPALTVPAVTVPAVTVPAVNTPILSVPSVSTPTLTVPAVTVPAVTTPSLSVPSVSTPTAIVPSITTPDLTVPSISIGSTSGNSGAGSLPDLNSGSGSLNSGSGSVPDVNSGSGSTISVPTVTIPTLTVPSVTVPTVDLTTPSLPLLPPTSPLPKI